MNHPRYSVVLICLLALVSIGEWCPAADAPDAGPSAGQLEIRGTQDFNRGRYITALPILKRLAQLYKDEPARLGPIQEKIHVCERAIASMKNTPTTQPTAVDATLEFSKRTPHPAPKAGETLQIAIKDLGNFSYDPERGGNIPADVVQLDGVKIRLRGFMVPLDQAREITQFALVPSLTICCIGQGPQVQHTVVVNVQKGKSVDYQPDEIWVEGTLHVRETKEEEYIVSIFDMVASSVKPAAGK